MASHNAAGQMVGYLYQVRYALNLLLGSDDPDYQISLEKFDDIAFEKDGTPIQLVQTKHHTMPASLNDSSVDLWRTINAWIDAVLNHTISLNNTDLVIVTTASIPTDSAMEAVGKGEYQIAFDRLSAAASDNNSKTNKRYYDKYHQISHALQIDIIKRIKIISASSDIVDVKKDIEKKLKYSCKPEHLAMVTERIEGWWFQECVRALISNDLVITTQRQLHAKIYEIVRQYNDDNLPIEFWDLDEIEESKLDPKDRIFIEQLRLLQYRSKTLFLAIQDYYRAAMQRSSWLRNGHIYVNDLDTYERRLKDAWLHAFAEMEEELLDYGIPTEQEKIDKGKALYSKIMDKDIRIRAGVDAPFVMKGTYHFLANSLTIGWHVDFFEKLKHLLEGVVQS